MPAEYSYLTGLSPTQRRIAALEADRKALVLAGPGTGKTHTLLRRLIFLVEHEGLEPNSEILVLSFSRAAVAEVRARLRRLIDEGVSVQLRFLNVRTFDSLATRLMLAADESADLSKLDYDGRIDLAVKRLEEQGSEAAAILMDIRHVVVDEIQDLVGARARLVKHILSLITGGFTLLGDPAQGIFNYLVEDKKSGPTSDEFLDGVRSQWNNELVEIELETNFRVSSSSADVASSVRPVVLHPRTMEVAFDKLREVISELPHAGTARKPDNRTVAPQLRRMALLCRTNAEALYISHAFNQNGIPSLSPPRGDEKGIPAWVGRIFSDWTERFITRDHFLERWEKLVGSSLDPEPEDSWELLKSSEARSGRDLDVERLKSQLRRGSDWAFDSEAFQDRGKLLVTTVHQAKGREYDRVVILPPDPGYSRAGTEAAFDEARILYVAATRAREDLFRVSRAGLPLMYEAIQPSRRKRFIGQDGEKLQLMEAGLPGDIDHTSYVSEGLFPLQKQAEVVQRVVWERLTPGEQVLLVPRKQGSSIEIVLVWMDPKTEKPIPIGLMDPLFKVDLEKYIRHFKPKGEFNYPPKITGLRVFERRTVVFPPYPERLQEPWASSGFCLGVGVKGLLELSL